MIIRIFDTDFDGNPVSCTGEFYTGNEPIDIVEAMKLDPFNASLSAIDFMKKILAKLKLKVALPNAPNDAAAVFIKTLISNGYAQ
jgi:hypothetical protein